MSKCFDKITLEGLFTMKDQWYKSILISQMIKGPEDLNHHRLRSVINGKFLPDGIYQTNMDFLSRVIHFNYFLIEMQKVKRWVNHISLPLTYENYFCSIMTFYFQHLELQCHNHFSPLTDFLQILKFLPTSASNFRTYAFSFHVFRTSTI